MTGFLLSLLGARVTGGGTGFTIVHTFTATSTWTCPSGVTEVEYLVVAGGGSGAYTGGGGAGGFRTGTGLSVTAGTDYTVTVGSGGTGAATGTRGTSGFAGAFLPVTNRLSASCRPLGRWFRCGTRT